VFSLALQEGFLSQRRLFFTDQDFAYICNKCARSETKDHLEAKLGPLRGCLPSNKSGFSGAIDLVQEYTGRDLTSDNDALNAILGALNTLVAQSIPVYHIWGVPFGPQMSKDQAPAKLDHGSQTVNLGLFWYHPRKNPPSPCRRIEGFPSWSPVGWKGKVQFIPFALDGYSATTIQFWQAGMHHRLHTRVLEGSNLRGLSLGEASRVLRIKAWTVAFEMRYTAPRYGKSEKEWYIEIQGKAVSSFVRPIWDGLESDFRDGQPGICLIDFGLEELVLVLFERDGLYERRACFGNGLYQGSRGSFRRLVQVDIPWDRLTFAGLMKTGTKIEKRTIYIQ
jgi:hypothetical protein